MNVDLSYVDNLVLRVRDNSKGIDPDVAAQGKGGHFGVIGIYERASRIRGKLTLSSSPGIGTELELVVPAGSFSGNKVRPGRAFARRSGGSFEDSGALTA